ncbi:3829_t:CDS:10, partial [Paraglomus brasilianum]
MDNEPAEPQQARLERRELRETNLAAWRNDKPDSAASKNFDSNIKKNIGFIKKVKTQLSAEYQQQLLKDIRTLTLAKYISEVVGAVIDGVQKNKSASDVWAAVERFPDTFTPYLSHTLFRSLSPPSLKQLSALTPEQREKEESVRIAKQRVLLRIAGELWLLGVLRNVEDGIALGNANNVVVGSASVNGVKDNVTGFAGGNAVKEPRSGESKDSKKEGEGFVYGVLKEMFAHDTKHLNLPLAVFFVKNFGSEMLGTVSRKQKLGSSEESATSPTNGGSEVVADAEDEAQKIFEGFVTKEQQAMFRNLLTEYFKGVEKHLVRDHEKIKQLEIRNHDFYISRGEIPEETKQTYEKVCDTFEKFKRNAQILADSLDLEMPDLPEDEGTTKLGGSVVKEGSSSKDKEDSFSSSIWEDEDAKSFYENLVDLRTKVPGLLLDGNTSIKSDADETKSDTSPGIDKDDKADDVKDESTDDITLTDSKTKSIQDAMTEMMDRIVVANDENEDASEKHSADDDFKDDQEDTTIGTDESNLKKDPEAAGKSATSAKLGSLLSRLPNMVNRDLIDQAAADFCFLNTKAARKKLIKTLAGVPRNRLDLLPYYARLIATLNPHFPDVGSSVLQALENEFKHLQKKKSQDLLETKIKNIRYLAELTKFRITPQHVIFHCLKVVLDDFSNQNIDIACNLLETCGRFLYKSPETNVRMSNMLDIMMRKKNVQHMDNRHILMVENAYYQCNPPDRAAVVKKDRSIMEQYIRKLVYTDLNKKTVEKVLKLLRKLHWDDKEVYRIIEKCFSKIWKIKYSNIHLMAILAAGLHRYHSDFGVALVDHILEDIRIGLEQNIFKYNQRRIAQVKYLGELYNYRMIDSPVIFDTLYTIVTLGHEFGRPSPYRPSALDAPNDYFRVRLCCTLLDTCGMCFDRGTSKERLDDFLMFFQMYILAKEKLPKDIDFMFTDTLEMLRPNMTMCKTYEEAAEQVDIKLLQNQKVLQSTEDATKSQEDNAEDSEASSESEEDDDEDVQEDELERDVIEDEGSDTESVSEVTAEGEEEEEVVVHTNRPNQSVSDEEEFEREFSKMMTESIESRKYERKPAMLDVAIPMHLKRGNDKTLDTDSSVAFTLLTKKGNKQQLKTMEVPANSALAVNTRTKQEAERVEQLQLKQIVLNYEEREEKNQREELEQSLTSSGFKVSFQSGGRRPSQKGRRQ